MTKKNIGILVASYVAFNVIVSYKAGVFKRMQEMRKYERSHPGEPRKTTSEFWNYAFYGNP